METLGQHLSGTHSGSPQAQTRDVCPRGRGFHRPLSLPGNPSMWYGQPISWQAQSGVNRSQEHQEMGTELEDN